VIAETIAKERINRNPVKINSPASVASKFLKNFM